VNDQLPDDQALAAALTSTLASTAGDTPAAPVTLLHRLPNPHVSSFPSEIVTCRLANGEHLRLLCKYGGAGHPGFGHRGGVAYEAEVYRRVLAAAPLTTPRFHGAVAAGPGGQVWLAIGFLEHALRLNHTRDPAFWEYSAAWAGRFHAHHEPRAHDPGLAFLNTYGAAYYAGWARRTAEYAAPQQADLPWLPDLCRRAEEALPELLHVPRTVIHGEYYPMNLLIEDGTVYPVDWESAALGPGEIDLATLTDGCEPGVVLRLENAYYLARSPHEPPPHSPRALDLARTYVHLRWLGATPGPRLRRRAWRYDELRTLGERLGLI